MKTVWFMSQYAGGLGVGVQYRHYQFSMTVLAQGHDAGIISVSYLYCNPPKVSSNGD